MKRKISIFLKYMINPRIILTEVSKNGKETKEGLFHATEGRAAFHQGKDKG